MALRQPNVLYVFADQLRAQATGYGGDPNARTPALDALAASAVSLTHAVSGVSFSQCAARPPACQPSIIGVPHNTR